MRGNPQIWRKDKMNSIHGYSNELEKVMTVQEAKECIENINANLKNTRKLLLDLYEREGWRALGYDSWRICVATEFKQSQAYLYRQLEAAQTEKAISPMGEKEIPERHLRPLTKLAPSEQKKVWDKVIKTAPEGKVTAKHVEETVKELKHTETYPVSDAMAFAGIAISQLQRIRDDDPLRKEAIQKVYDWCTTNI